MALSVGRFLEVAEEKKIIENLSLKFKNFKAMVYVTLV